MKEQYAFFFDARFCSGCKACQAACKDKNNLPPGVLWRRVIEVSGGSWQKDGVAWNNTVFAYNFSIACNHCLHPKCAGICPVNAFIVREDGIVILDETKCMGCGYCGWGCPYDVPQYDYGAGHMSKCDFCFDQLEQGLPPACVAACPLRVLEYGEMASSTPAPNEIRLWEAPSNTHPYPLPVTSHTQPRLAVKQHPAMCSPVEKHLANREEIRPRSPSAGEDLPLLIFTLLGQMAVGGLWAVAWMFPPVWSQVRYEATFLRVLPLLLIGGCLAGGMLASLAHLGTKKNAWRVFTNLRHSSISKEVFYTGLFGISILFGVVQILFLKQDLFLITAFASIAGLALVYNMAQVYRLRAAPGWNTWRTNAGFLVSALLLGLAAMTPILYYESISTGIQIRPGGQITVCVIILALLIMQLLLMRKRPGQSPAYELRMGLLLLGMGIAAASLFGHVDFTRTSLLIFAVVILEETLGRWLFYRSRL